MKHQNFAVIFGYQLKVLKKRLPSSCSYLSTLKKKSGEIQIKAVVNREDFFFSVPQDLSLNAADIQELERAILSKC